MANMRLITILGLALLVTIAGCSSVSFGDPTPQKEPAPVMLVNNATQTETFMVGVVGVGDNLTVQDGNGDSFNYTINQGSSTYTTSDASTLTRIDFPESTKRHGEYTLLPGEKKQIDIEGVAPDEAIVVLVYDEEDATYRSIKTLSCGGAIQGYRVTSQKGGPDDWTMSTHQCSNW
jgi:predicted component of type VI protein secretion system